MNFWTPDHLRSVCAGTWLSRPPAIEAAPLAGLSIDSRALTPGQVFVAIKGDRFDGHDFLAAAVEAGAPMLIVDREPPAKFDRTLVLKVADTRRALQRLAAAYRQSLTATRVVAVCGSNGKTTTTRLIHAVLAHKLRGTASLKSFNNDIGVPLTILSAKPSDQFLLCEVGSNAPGEIAALGEIVRPDVAVITSIGREHLEKLGSLEGVAREEAAILGALRPGGLAVVTGDTPLLDEHVRGVTNLVRFGREARCDLRLTAFEHVERPTPPGPNAPSRPAEGWPNAMRFEINGRWTFEAPLVGEHNALNALAAVAVARRFGLTDDELAQGLEHAAAPGMRLERTVVRGVHVINDAYNANPDSTLAALRAFAALSAAAERRVIVLGDMLELGPAGPDAHREIGAEIRALGVIDVLVTVGSLAALAAEMFAADAPRSGRVFSLSDLDGDRAAEAAALLRPGDAVLLKGSRRMGLERVVAALTKRAVSTAELHVEPRSPRPPAPPPAARTPR